MRMLCMHACTHVRIHVHACINGCSMQASTKSSKYQVRMHKHMHARIPVLMYDVQIWHALQGPHNSRPTCAYVWSTCKKESGGEREGGRA